MNPSSKIVIALSGGVDSAVAAALLKQDGWSVHGVHFILPGPREQRENLVSRTKRICEHLEIPLEFRDLKTPFQEAVITPFTAAYIDGKTPNPCVLCNERVKFPMLAQHADEIGAGFIATGHYAVVERQNGLSLLKRGADPDKEQAYFLHRIPSSVLSRVLFPLGHLTKNDIRREAARRGLPVQTAGESQEICFLAGADYRDFVGKAGPAASAKPGRIVDAAGHQIGSHSGAYRYTIGQRHGLGIASPRPYYVMAIRPHLNEIVVGRREELYSTRLEASRFVWTGSASADSGSLEVLAQIRYRHKAAGGRLDIIQPDRVVLKFREPQWAVTPGQALVCYDGEQVLGGGWIIRAWAS